ncbi:MAG: glycoside hydrolase family 127 protein, partial [Clostridia bacterium]|nr:glycoside hydrolase family 127 protein [Clostridia bacterium]
MVNENVFLRHTDPERVFARVRKAGVTEQRIYPGGTVKEMLGFLSDTFLKDRATWKQFTEQFRFSADVGNGGWRCEYWGKMMRGAAYVCAVTKDPALYDVLRETVEDLLTAQDELGRFSTYPPEQEFFGWDMWGRKYVLLGFMRFLDLCEDDTLRARILEAMKRHADYIVERIGPEREGKIPVSTTSRLHRGMNSVSILEPMVLLYDMTGEQRYLDFATYLVEEGA